MYLFAHWLWLSVAVSSICLIELFGHMFAFYACNFAHAHSHSRKSIVNESIHSLTKTHNITHAIHFQPECLYPTYLEMDNVTRADAEQLLASFVRTTVRYPDSSTRDGTTTSPSKDSKQKPRRDGDEPNKMIYNERSELFVLRTCLCSDQHPEVDLVLYREQWQRDCVLFLFKK